MERALREGGRIPALGPVDRVHLAKRRSARSGKARS